MPVAHWMNKAMVAVFLLWVWVLRVKECPQWVQRQRVVDLLVVPGPDPRKVDTSGVSYAAWVSVADVSASKSLGARRLHQECRLRVL